jgi:AsmA protein
MGRLLKLIGIVFGALVVLVIGLAVGVALFFDPNDYKDQITAAVGNATGRELTLDGDLELSVFPSLRISLGPATLSNAEGFGDQPFAEIERASLDVDLLPLLSRRIAVSEAELDGLVLNLARDAQGRNNWQDLGGDGAAEPAPAADEDGGAAAVDLNVDVIRVRDSQVTWNDAATGSSWVLGDFNLVASGFGPDVAFPVDMRFTLAGEALRVAVRAETRATLSLVNNAYRLENLAVALAGQGERWPGGEGEARLSFAAFTANLDDETLDLDRLTLEFLNVTAHGSLAGRQLMTDLALGGSVEIEQFDPSALLGVFDVDIETADPGVLRRASAAATFVYDSSQIGLRDMRLALDDSALTGSVGMQGESLRFDLRVDQINVDRYLPPAEDDADAPADEGSLDEVDLPLDVLRELDASGSLAFGPTQFSGMSLNEATFALNARNGQVRLQPTASLYGGRLVGDIRLDIQPDTARAALTSEVTGVDLLPLGRDLLDSEMVSGRGDLRLDLTTTGSNVGQMRRDLDGEVAFAARDGAWEGFDLWFELVRARTVFDGQSPPVRPEGPRRTPFSTVSASGDVQDAILTNRDLNATLAFMTVDGEGTVNLLTDALDFDLVATFVDGEALQSQPLMARLGGQRLPLRVGGTLAEPSVAPDYRALVRAQVQEAVTERLDEERGEVEQRLEEERSEVRQQVEEERGEVRERIEEERQELRERLRGILNRWCAASQSGLFRQAPRPRAGSAPPPRSTRSTSPASGAATSSSRRRVSRRRPRPSSRCSSTTRTARSAASRAPTRRATTSSPPRTARRWFTHAWKAACCFSAGASSVSSGSRSRSRISFAPSHCPSRATSPTAAPSGSFAPSTAAAPRSRIAWSSSRIFGYRR